MLSIKPKILEILVGSQMESSVLVPSDQNINFGTTSGGGPEYAGQNILTEICCSILINWFIALLLSTYVHREFGNLKE